MQNDRLLLGIVAGIAVIVVAAFGLAVRQPAPDYTTGTAPQDVALNYLLALRRGDYERAYGYVAPTVAGYPATLEQFVDEGSDLARYNPDQATTESVESTTVTGDRAVVTVRQTSFDEGGLFESQQYDSEYMMRLERSPGDEWRIAHSDIYWYHCWDRPADCRDRGNVPLAPVEAYP